jgi:hypothetical protein
MEGLFPESGLLGSLISHVGEHAYIPGHPLIGVLPKGARKLPRFPCFPDFTGLYGENAGPYGLQYRFRRSS